MNSPVNQFIKNLLLESHGRPFSETATRLDKAIQEQSDGETVQLNQYDILVRSHGREVEIHRIDGEFIVTMKTRDLVEAIRAGGFEEPVDFLESIQSLLQ
jgi:hypothetical protein